MTSPRIIPLGKTTLTVNIPYFGRSGKQSEKDMHVLHDDDGRGPGTPGLLGGRHKPMAAMQ